MALLFSSDRQFQLWAYRVGHSQLVIRSPKDEQHGFSTQIDILFEQAIVQNVCSLFRGLRITEVPRLSHLKQHFLEADKHAYEIETEGFTGYIVARSMDYDENRKEYYEPDKWQL